MRFAAPFAAVGAAVLLLSACSTQSGNDFHFTDATKPGQLIPVAQRHPAARVTGRLFSGRSWTLAADRGQVVLLNFWASWCAPCRFESPMLEGVYRAVHRSGVDFIGVDMKDERQAAESFIADEHMTYPMVYDEPANIALRLGIPVGGLPVTAVIDRAGRVAAVYIGRVYQPDIERILARLVAEPAA